MRIKKAPCRERKKTSKRCDSHRSASDAESCSTSSVGGSGAVRVYKPPASLSAVIPMNEFKQTSTAEIRINEKYINMLPPLEDEQLRGLEEDIAKRGILSPLIVNKNLVLIDGYHRLRIAKKLGIKEIPVKILDFEDELAEKEYVILANLNRRQLTIAQRAELALKLEEIEAEKARRRQVELGRVHGMLGGRGIKKGSEKYEEKRSRLELKEKTLRSNLTQGFFGDEKSKALEIAAMALGVSYGTAWKARKIAEAIQKGDTHVAREWERAKRGERSVNSVYKILTRREHVEMLREKITQLPRPKGKYDVINTDPPWPYNEDKYDPDWHRGVVPYPTMSIEEIKAEPIPEYANDDCLLWLWTTNTFIREAFEILDAWGFEYKTMLTWVKPRIGTGRWLRSQTEHCLLGVRGKPKIVLTNQSTVLLAPVREHSEKPEEFYKMVESLWPGARRLDYFGRRKRGGWDVFGTLEFEEGE